MLESAQILEILRDVTRHLWLGDFIMLCFLLCLPAKDKIISSGVIALVVVVVIGGLSFKYSQMILQPDPKIDLTPVQAWLKIHQEIMLFVWYIGLAAFDCAAMFAIHILHHKYRIPNGYIAEVLVLASFADGMLNLTRLTERYYWGSDYLHEVYQWGIPSINIGATLVAAVTVGKLTYRHYRRKNLNGVA